MNWSILFISTLLIELVLSFTWNKYYFRYGIPIYFHSKVFKGTVNLPELVKKINFSKKSHLLLRQLNNNEAAVREVFGILSRHGVMHGHIYIDEKNHLIRFNGNLDWTIIIFAIILIGIKTWVLFPFVLIIIALYFSVRSNFNSLWSHFVEGLDSPE